MIRYIVVNAPSLHNLLLGQPFMNRLEAVVSSVHLKVKFLTTKDKIVSLQVDHGGHRTWQMELVLKTPKG